MKGSSIIVAACFAAFVTLAQDTNGVGGGSGNVPAPDAVVSNAPATVDAAFVAPPVLAMSAPMRVRQMHAPAESAQSSAREIAAPRCVQLPLARPLMLVARLRVACVPPLALLRARWPANSTPQGNPSSSSASLCCFSGSEDDSLCP